MSEILPLIAGLFVIALVAVLVIASRKPDTFRIERSALISWQISAMRSYMAKVMALRACGRLKVIRAMPSWTE